MAVLSCHAACALHSTTAGALEMKGHLPVLCIFHAGLPSTLQQHSSSQHEQQQYRNLDASSC
jgi:hypothetical protein